MIPNSVACTFNAGTLGISSKRPSVSSPGFASNGWKREARAAIRRCSGSASVAKSYRATLTRGAST